MASFEPNIPENARGGAEGLEAFKEALRELRIQTTVDSSGLVHIEFTPGSYEPMAFRCWAPEDLGLIALEGEVMTLASEASEDLALAINYLNVALDTCRYYLSADVVCVRADVLPTVLARKWFHPKEVREVLTLLCTQRKMFADALASVQDGRPWSAVKDALRAFR